MWNSPSSSLLPGLELSDTIVYAPSMRALHGTASYFCEVVVLELRGALIGTALNLRIFRVIRRGAQAMYKRGDALNPLGGEIGGAQAKLSA